LKIEITVVSKIRYEFESDQCRLRSSVFSIVVLGYLSASYVDTI